MKKMILVCLALSIPGFAFATTPFFLNKFILGNHPTQSNLTFKRVSNQHVNFSGHWEGSCDDDPQSKQTINIDQEDDSNQMIVDDLELYIDAINHFGRNSQSFNNGNALHIRWSENGQQLLLTSIRYIKEGDLSQDKFDSTVGSWVWSLEDGKFIVNSEMYNFRDGKPVLNGRYVCTFSKTK